jgi:LPXTG-site transpeptidase (sortase) family protein
MILRVRMPGWRSVARCLSNILLAVGVCLTGFVLWNTFDSARYQAIQSRRFDAVTRVKAASAQASVLPAAAPVPAFPVHQLPPGETSNAIDPLLIGRIEIPRLGVRAMVREGVELGTLRRAVGHMPGTALPGEPGNFVAAGHRDSFFRGLRSVQNGDEIRVTTFAGSFVYRVDNLSVVGPNDLAPAQPTATAICTLVTCFPFDYIGSAPRRFIVRASLENTQKP